MLIRFGFDISISCYADVPMVLALSPHPDFKGRIIGDDSITVNPDGHSADPQSSVDRWCKFRLPWTYRVLGVFGG